MEELRMKWQSTAIPLNTYSLERNVGFNRLHALLETSRAVIPHGDTSAAILPRRTADPQATPLPNQQELSASAPTHCNASEWFTGSPAPSPYM